MSRIFSLKNSLLLSFIIVFLSTANFLNDWGNPSYRGQRYVLKNITAQEFLALYDDLKERDTLLQGLDEWSAWFRGGDRIRSTYLYDIDCRVSFFVKDSLGNTELRLVGLTTDMRDKRQDCGMYGYRTHTFYCFQAQHSFEKCVLDRLWPYKKDYIQGFLAWYSNFCFRNFFWIIGFLVLFVYLCFFYEKKRSFESLFRIIENREWQRLTSSLNRKERPGLPYCITSVLLYLSSFLFYAYYDDILLHYGTYGVECFIYGLISSIPVLVVELLNLNFDYLWIPIIWFANLLYWISTYYYLLKKRKRGIYFVNSSIVLGIPFLLVPIGVKMAGYYLWISSFVVMLIALLKEDTTRESEKPQTNKR